MNYSLDLACLDGVLIPYNDHILALVFYLLQSDFIALALQIGICHPSEVTIDRIPTLL